MKTWEVWYMFPDEYFVDKVDAHSKDEAIEISLKSGGDRKRISYVCIEGQ